MSAATVGFWALIVAYYGGVLWWMGRVGAWLEPTSPSWWRDALPLVFAHALALGCLLWLLGWYLTGVFR